MSGKLAVSASDRSEQLPVDGAILRLDGERFFFEVMESESVSGCPEYSVCGGSLYGGVVNIHLFLRIS